MSLRLIIQMENESEFSQIKGVAAPAQRALAGIGITKLGQLPSYSQGELSKLHGMGPKALRILEELLVSKGMAFKAD